MFVTVDKSYKDVMRRVNKVPLAIRAATQPGETPTYCSSLPVMLNEAKTSRPRPRLRPGLRPRPRPNIIMKKVPNND